MEMVDPDLRREWQKKFVRDLMQSLTEGMLERSDKFPTEWKGIELRTYVREYVARCAWGLDKGKHHERDRYRSYQREVAKLGL